MTVLALNGAPYRLAQVRARWALAAITAVIIVAWLSAVFLFDSVRFVVFSLPSNTGFEVFLALGQLFAALVLALSAIAPARPRMKWVATGLLILGLGALGFGYLYPLIDDSPHLNVIMYGSVHVRTVAMILIAIGLVPRKAPPLDRNVVAGVLSFACLVGIGLILFGDELPRLVRESDLERITATSSDQAFPGLTSWHLALGLIPLFAGLAACWGAVNHYQGHVFGGWLVVAIVLWTGAQLHSLFWPSMYTSILTTTSVLRFGLTIVLITGGILELRYLSLEHATLLAHEQERVRQLQQLALLKRDFTSIVAHELATPLAAIANLSNMISLGVLSPSAQQQAAGKIQGETQILQLLVKDIQSSADVDRDDFTVHVRSVPLASLIGDADAYARIVRAQQWDFTVTVPEGTPAGQYVAAIVVRAEGERTIPGSDVFTQVLRSTMSIEITVPGALSPGFEFGSPEVLTDVTGRLLEIPITNTGNVLVKPAGELRVTTPAGEVVSTTGVAMGSVYGGNTTSVRVALPGQLPLGDYLVTLNLTDEATGATASISDAPVTLAEPDETETFAVGQA